MKGGTSRDTISYIFPLFTHSQRRGWDSQTFTGGPFISLCWNKTNNNTEKDIAKISITREQNRDGMKGGTSRDIISFIVPL